MKKILGTTLAAALLIPGPANAEILKNLKVNGTLSIQGNAARNVTDFSTRGNVATAAPTATGQDRIGSVSTRLLVDMAWDLLDDIHSMVTLRKNDRAWGGVGGVGQGAAGSQAIQAAGGAGAGVIGNIFVDQANIKIDKALNSIDMTVGRQFYGDAGDLIIAYGAKDNYGQYVTAIDAARFDWSNDWLAFNGLVGKTAAGALAAATADTNVRGFDLLWKSLPVKAHTYVWNRVTQGANALGTAPTNAAAATGLNDNLWVYGVKLRGEAMGGWLSADLAANGGEDRTTTAGVGCGTAGCNANSANYQGKAFLLDAGYNAEMSGIGALTPWVNFGYGTGRSSNLEARNEGFTSIATDYRPGIINRRFVQGAAVLGNTAGTAGLNNRVVYGLGLNVTPAAWEKLTVGTQLWSYNLQRVTATNALTAAGAETGAKHLGTEFGVTADWKHSENVKYGVGIASYQPGGFVKQAIRSAAGGATTGNNPATLAFADLTVKF